MSIYDEPNHLRLESIPRNIEEDIKAYDRECLTLPSYIIKELREEADQEQRRNDANFELACKAMGINWSHM